MICVYCSGSVMECECPEHNAPAASYSSSGLPIDESGALLVHLMTQQQLRDVERVLRQQREARMAAPNFRVRQAS
jgi:hypothetical protein